MKQNWNPIGIVVDACGAEMSAICSVFNHMTAKEFVMEGWKCEYNWTSSDIQQVTLLLRCMAHEKHAMKRYCHNASKWPQRSKNGGNILRTTFYFQVITSFNRNTPHVV